MTAMTTQRTTVWAACLGWFFAAVDTVLLILFQKQVADSLHVDPQVIRIAIGVGLLGSATGGIAFAQLGDRIGRVRTLGWSVMLYSLATAGMAFAPTAGWLMGFRFLAGIGTGAGLLYLVVRAGGDRTALYAVFAAICVSFGIGSVLGSLVSEIFPTHLRSTGPGISQNIGKGLGGMFGPTMTGLMLPKLGYAVVLALPGVCRVVLALLIWLLPEVGGREIRPVERDSVADATAA